MTGNEIRYTHDELVRELRRVAQLIKKPVLSEPDFTKLATISVDCIRRRFGSWREALEGAGIGEMYSGKKPSPRPVSYYTDKTLLAEVRRVARLIEKPPLTRAEFRKRCDINPDTLTRRFGDWRIVLERAGVPHMYSGRAISDLKRASRRFTSDTEVLDLIRHAATQTGGNHLTYEVCRKLTGLGTSTINRRFGNWKGALEAAGLSAEGVPKHYTDEECFENLAAVWKHYRRPPNRRQIERPPSVVGGHVYMKRWGSWPEVLEAFLEWTDGGQAAQPPVDGDRRFESWRSALAAVGLPRGRFTRLHTDEECFQNLADLWQRYGQPPSAKKLNLPPSKISAGAYQARWGTWCKAVEAFVLWADATHLPPPTDGTQQFGSWKSAGFDRATERKVPRRYTEEECFQNLADVWTHYGRQPSSSKLNLPPSKVRLGVYLGRWGTWPKAVEAFLEWAKSTSSSR
ncbi:MAG: hypothetical protein Q7T82_05630 [Armatimonadota bacterium]|nr:hypothetical protein [Armatimonadota bacterium]